MPQNRQNNPLAAKNRISPEGDLLIYGEVGDFWEGNDAMTIVDIAAMEPRPAARRFEVYGDEGSAIMEPFEPAETLRLCLARAKDGYPAGVSVLKLEARPRYVASLAAFIQDVRREKQPDRSLDHELTVQETLLRATGAIQT